MTGYKTRPPFTVYRGLRIRASNSIKQRPVGFFELHLWRSGKKNPSSLFEEFIHRRIYRMKIFRRSEDFFLELQSPKFFLNRKFWQFLTVKIQLCTVKLLVFSFVRLYFYSSNHLRDFRHFSFKFSKEIFEKFLGFFGQVILKNQIFGAWNCFNNFAIYPICRDCRVGLVLRSGQFEGYPRNKPAQTWTVGLIKVQTRLQSGVNILSYI